MEPDAFRPRQRAGQFPGQFTWIAETIRRRIERRCRIVQSRQLFVVNRGQMREQFFTHFSLARRAGLHRTDRAFDNSHLRNAGLENLRGHRSQIQTKISQNLPGNAVGFEHQSDHQMFRADLFLIQVRRFLLR